MRLVDGDGDSIAARDDEVVRPAHGDDIAVAADICADIFSVTDDCGAVTRNGHDLTELAAQAIVSGAFRAFDEGDAVIRRDIGDASFGCAFEARIRVVAGFDVGIAFRVDVDGPGIRRGLVTHGIIPLRAVHNGGVTAVEGRVDGSLLDCTERRHRVSAVGVEGDILGIDGASGSHEIQNTEDDILASAGIGIREANLHTLDLEIDIPDGRSVGVSELELEVIAVLCIESAVFGVAFGAVVECLDKCRFVEDIVFTGIGITVGGDDLERKLNGRNLAVGVRPAGGHHTCAERLQLRFVLGGEAAACLDFQRIHDFVAVIELGNDVELCEELCILLELVELVAVQIPVVIRLEVVVIKRGVERGVRAEVGDGGEALEVLGFGCEHELVVDDIGSGVVDKAEAVDKARVHAIVVDIQRIACVPCRDDDHTVTVGFAGDAADERRLHIILVEVEVLRTVVSLFGERELDSKRCGGYLRSGGNVCLAAGVTEAVAADYLLVRVARRSRVDFEVAPGQFETGGSRVCGAEIRRIGDVLEDSFLVLVLFRHEPVRNADAERSAEIELCGGGAVVNFAQRLDCVDKHVDGTRIEDCRTCEEEVFSLEFVTCESAVAVELIVRPVESGAGGDCVALHQHIVIVIAVDELVEVDITPRGVALRVDCGD